VRFYLGSDFHISRDDCDLDGVRIFCERAKIDGCKVILNGDIFDVLYEPVDYIGSEYQDVIRELTGINYLYMIGNHDNFIQRVPILTPWAYPSTVLYIDGKKWLIEHGHLIGKYACLFATMDIFGNSYRFREMVRWISKRTGFQWAGRKSDEAQFEQAAINKAMLHGCDVVYCGHTHVPKIREFGGVTYVNPGSAIKTKEYPNMTYIIYDNGRFFLEEAV